MTPTPLRTAMRLPATVVIAMIFLSGCASTESATDSSSQGQDLQPSTTPSASVLEFAACRQYHTYFSARAEDFQDQVPTGFALAADEAGLIGLRVEATACGAGPGDEDMDMLWITVPVIPPQALADANASHALAIEAYVDSAAALAWLHDADAHVAEPCACVASEAPAPLLADAFTVDGESDDYSLQTALTSSRGPFAAFRGWTYVAVDGEAVVRILADNQESTNRGFGSVVLAYMGPGGAPPATPGQIAHVVEGLAFTWTAEPLAVA